MKKQRAFEQDGKLVIQTTFDAEPALKQAAALRSSGVTGWGENRLAARIPLDLIHKWCVEAGVRWDDTEARRDLIHKKLLSGEASKFRVWEGSY